MERELKQSAEYVEKIKERNFIFASALDSLNCCVAIMNRESHIIYTNKSWDNHINQLTDLSKDKWGSYRLVDLYQRIAGISDKDLLLLEEGINRIIKRKIDKFKMEYSCISNNERRWYFLRIDLFIGAGPYAYVLTIHDITEEKSFYEEQRRILDYIPELITRHDSDLKISFVNSSLKGFLGYNPDTILSDPDNVNLPDDILKKWEVELNKVITYQEKREFEIEVLLEGQKKYFHTRFLPEIINDDTMSGIIGITADITEKKEMEASLAVQRANMKQLFENSPLAIALLDEDNRPLKINLSFTKLYGYVFDELQDKDLFSILVPDNLYKEVERINNQTIIGNEVVIESKRKRKDGSLIDVKLTAFPVLLESNRIGKYILYEDISKRKKAERLLRNSEARFRSYINNAPDGIFVINYKGQCLEVNDAALHLTGYTREELLKLNLFALMMEGDQARASGMINRLKNYGQVEGDFTFKKREEQVWYAYLNAVKIRGGKYLVFIKDITNLKQAHQALLEEQEKYNKLYRKFTDSMMTSLLKMMELHDPYTGGHSVKVARLAVRIAREMGLPENEIQQCYWASLVHDIGKVLIPNDILEKSGKITDEEYQIVKNHPIWGYDVLKDNKELADIALYVRHHHENWDGTGYPDGLQKQQIPLISAIIRIADVWETLLTKRSYRPAYDIDSALGEMQKGKASVFSPEILDIFFKII